MEVLAAKRQHSAALLEEAAGKRQRACCEAPGYLHSMDCSLPTQGLWALSHGNCDYNDSDVDEDEVGGPAAASDLLWPAPTVGPTKLQPAAHRVTDLQQPDLRPSHCGTELHFFMPPLAQGLGWDDGMAAPVPPPTAQGLQHTPPATPCAPTTTAVYNVPAKHNPFAWTVDSPLPPLAAPAAAQQHLHNLLGSASPSPHAATPPAILTTAAADYQHFSEESYPSTPTGAGIPERRSPPPAPLRRGIKAFLLQDDIPTAGASSYINNLLDDDWYGGAAQPGMKNSNSGCGLAWLDGSNTAPRARSLSRSSSSESLSSASGGSIMSAVMAALPRGPAPAPDRAAMPPPPPVSRRLFDDSFLNNVQSVQAPRPAPPAGISPWLYDMLRPAELHQEQQALLSLQQQGVAAEQQEQ